MALVNTTKGEMEESLLEKKTGVEDNENERIDWVEYWLDSELVHRSAHITLKKYSLTGEAVAASFG
jgi:hypothetical protein